MLTSPRSAVVHVALFTLAVLLTSCASVEDVAAQRHAEEPEPIQAGVAPPPGPYAPGFDAVHYHIRLVLPDEGNFIEGTTTGRFRVVPPQRDTLSLDLTGLAVTNVEVGGQAAAFRLDAGKLHVKMPAGVKVGDTLAVAVAYRGEPDDGLIIGANLHGEPAAFADNWPNRARYWFPSIDHPSDKATVTFEVHVPPAPGRMVIANGRMDAGTDESVWRWSNPEPIPTYTMVIGMAGFDVTTVGEACAADVCTDVTTWLFPADAERGSGSFRRAAQMVEFYSELIAPYPYTKLAHVQSSTRFGGMENVTAVFYPEEAISEGRNIETTVAHETAHQWFGNAVTESDWHHLWLSEGFATYFGALFFERADGREAFRELMESNRQGYLRSGAASEPIVNPEQQSLFGLLNANNYAKGGWVLHMLRSQLGDEVFFEGIRSYYRRHEHGTALTDDLQEAMEAAAGRSLETFFEQWVFRPGHPRLAVEWSWRDGEAEVAVRQTQSAEWPEFRFPLDLSFETPDGAVRHTVQIEDGEERFVLGVRSEPSALDLDPDGAMLMEIESIEGEASR
ncbi:MAG: M1 family metallopeptidase [Rhodothermales bacterium]